LTAPPSLCCTPSNASAPQVCGLFMQSTDSEARKRDHIEGKQYKGTG